MASPLRSSQKGTFLGPGNGNTIRKSFNVNVVPKVPSRNNTNHSVFTPANSPADYHGRVSSPFKDLTQSEEIKEIDVGLENLRPCPPKSVKSPPAKGMKNFMAPTFSAASKAAAASPKKRVLGDRNEVSCPAKTPAKSSSVVSKSLDFMEVNPIELEARVLSERNGGRVPSPEPKERSESLSFLAQFPDPDEEISSPLPPYDPKKNYLSPRPQFLRYRPNRGLEFVDVAEVEERLEKDKGFKPEILTPTPTPTPCDSGVTEIKEVQSLGERMTAMGVTVEEEEVVGCEEIQGKLIPCKSGKQGFCSPNLGFKQEEMCNPSVGCVQEDVCNTNLGSIEEVVCNPNMESEDKKNIHVEEIDEEDCDDEDEDDEEEQKQNSGWMRRALMFTFVFLCASVSLLASGSPGLLPSSLHNNAVAVGYSKMRSEEIVKNMKDWLDLYSVAKPGTQAKLSSMEDVLQNSFDNRYVEVSGEDFDKGNYVKSSSLSSEFFEDTVGVQDVRAEESSRESIMDAHDPFYFSLASTEQRTDVNGAEEVSQILGTEYYTELEVLPEFEEILGTLEEVSYFRAPIEKEQDIFTFETMEDSFPEVHSEEVNIITEHGSLEGKPPGNFDADEVLSAESCKDSRFNELSYSLNMQSRASGTLTGEVQRYQTEDFESTESNENSISQAKDTVPVPEVSCVFSAEDKVLSSESCEDSQFSEVSYSLNMQSKASGTLTGEVQSYQAEDFESIESSEESISQAEDTAPVPEESSMASAEDDLKGSEVQDYLVPERSATELPLSGTTAFMSILVAILIASIYFISASRKKSRISNEDVTRKSSVEFIGKEAQQHFFSPPQPMEKPYYPMNFSSHQMSPQVEFLTEYYPEEASSSDRHVDRRNDQGTYYQAYERRSRRGQSSSSVSPQDYPVTSEFSSESPSYGSFTTYEKIVRKEGGGDEEPKVMKVVTPVRRSSRLRKHQSVSPR